MITNMTGFGWFSIKIALDESSFRIERVKKNIYSACRKMLCFVLGLSCPVIPRPKVPSLVGKSCWTNIKLDLMTDLCGQTRASRLSCLLSHSLSHMSL